MRRPVVCGWLLSLGMAAGLLWKAPAAEPADTRSLFESEPEGWEDLLSGSDLKSWKRVVLPGDEKLNVKDKNPWSLDPANKLLVCDGVGRKEMLLHERERDDGVFHVEWRFKKVEGKSGYNSGVYVRSALDGRTWHQVQVAHLKQPPFLGDIFGDTPVGAKIQRVVIRGEGDKRARPPGEWNTYEVTCKGKTIRVWINGAVTSTWDECPVPKGHVGLQAEFFLIEFRNLKYRSLH